MPMLCARRAFPPATLALAALFAAGCGSEDGVRSYRVPKTAVSTARTAPAAAGEYRLFGAMYPAADPVWFLKFSGPADELAKYEADFDQLAASVQLPPGGRPPDFTPPPGWTRGPGRGGIVTATVKTPDGALEVTVSSSTGGVQQNLGRWVGMIGLKPGPGDADKYTRPLDAVGVTGLKVDLRGPKDPATARGPMMGGP